MGIIFSQGLSGAGAEIYQYFIEFFFGTFFPAFILAAGIKVFIRERSITRWMGPQVKGVISYGFALVSGLLFSVCACGVLPLFASIYRHGAGVGPAVTFLVAGPAINVTAIILTTTFFSWQMTAARTVGALLMALIIGVFFAKLFKQPEDQEFVKNDSSTDAKKMSVTCDCKEEGDEDFDLLAPDYNYLEDDELDEAFIPLPLWQVVLLFVVTFLYMVTGPIDFAPWLGNDIGPRLKAGLLLGYTLFLLFFLYKFLNKEDRREWIEVIVHFIWKISWPLITGLALLGFCKGNLSQGMLIKLVGDYLGSNQIGSLTLASLFAVPTYFGTCVSVVYVKFFMDFGMASGPALTMFLAGPTISIPSFLPMVKIMGWKRSLFITVMIFVVSLGLTILSLPLIN